MTDKLGQMEVRDIKKKKEKKLFDKFIHNFSIDWTNIFNFSVIFVKNIPSIIYQEMINYVFSYLFLYTVPIFELIGDGLPLVPVYSTWII